MNPISITLLQNQFAAFPFQGQDASGNKQAIHGTVTISDYSVAFAFIYSGGVDIVFKNQPPAGGQQTVSATINAFDANGGTLPPVTLQATQTGPAGTPLATQVVPGTPVAVSPGNTDFGVPVDPGTAFPSFSL